MQSRGFVGWFGLGACLVVLGACAACQPKSTRRADAALDQALRAVLDQGGQQRLGVSSRAEALLALRRRVPESAVHLSPHDLQAWADVRLRLARASPQACARFWMGGENPAALAALETFNDEQLRDWAEMSARGVALSLERPRPAPGPAALSRGLAAVAAQLPLDKRSAFAADVQKQLLVDSRACQMFLLVMSGARGLPPEQQDELLRALAASTSR